ncbi:unnamed protein product [Arabidopsis halleri]
MFSSYFWFKRVSFLVKNNYCILGYYLLFPFLFIFTSCKRLMWPWEAYKSTTKPLCIFYA